ARLATSQLRVLKRETSPVDARRAAKLAAAVESFAAHPFQKYFQAGFRCTLNTDNTLMSATTLSQEWQIARDHYGLGLADFERLAVDGVLGSFLPYAERRALIDERIRPAYQASPPT
ncbi:MAG: hypothetical protein AAFU79_28595, partial [Myxococcota bacterium]